MLTPLVVELLRGGVPVRLVATGASMEPTFADGDTLEVQPLCGEPAIGRVALYAVGTRLIAHRIVGLERSPAGDIDRVIMQGDAVPLPDQPVPRADVLGLVVPERAGWLRRLRALVRRVLARVR